jgi:hypothetical protein
MEQKDFKDFCNLVYSKETPIVVQEDGPEEQITF